MSEQDASAGRERWLAIGAVAALMALVVRNAWVCEDAYLTLRTIDNWVHGYGLRWNVDERVQAYTHPLWMLLVTVPYAIVNNPYGAALATSLLVTLGAVIALVYLARSGHQAVVAVVLLLLSRSFVDFSTSGLENPLSHLLLAWLVWLYAVKRANIFPIALVAALLALNRTDSFLVAIPPLVHTAVLSFRERGWKPMLKDLTLGLSPYLAWELFSLFYYGFLVPNTALAKLNTGLPRGEVARQGLAYLTNAIAWDPALFFVLALGLSVGLIRRQLRNGLLVLSAILYIVYVVQIGGDFMQGRFLTIPLFLATCLVAIAPLALQDFSRVGVLLLPAAALFLLPTGTDLKYAYAGVADEREHYQNELALSAFTRTGSMPTHIFRTNGEQFAVEAASEPVRLGYNVGITGFYAGPHVHIVDTNALSDPLLARLPIRHDPNWRIGHYTRQPPPGYLESEKTGKCKMPDPNLCAYYEKLKLIVAGDLWSWSRFKAIAAINLGRYEALIDKDRYRFPEYRRENLTNLSVVLPENAAWNDDRARMIPNDGIEVDLGMMSHAKQVAISFDGNDRYEVRFKREGHAPAVTSPAEPGGGMRTRSLDTPAEAVEHGFDQLVIRPLSGDGMYSIGYVRLLP